MIDTSTQKPLHVSTDGDALPYIMVSVKHIDELRKFLDSKDVHYWADEYAISLNGEPEVAIINLSRDSNAAFVQNLLDKAS